jgi:hypothetical protein
VRPAAKERIGSGTSAFDTERRAIYYWVLVPQQGAEKARSPCARSLQPARSDEVSAEPMFRGYERETALMHSGPIAAAKTKSVE